MRGQNLDYANGLNAAVPEQTQSPQGPNLLRVIRGISQTNQPVDARLALRQSIGCELYFDGGSAQARVTGIERDRGELAELGIPLKLAAPGVDTRGDLGFGLGFVLVCMTTSLFVSISVLAGGSVGAAHGAFEKDLGLFLRPLPVQITVRRHAEGYRRICVRQERADGFSPKGSRAPAG